MVSELDLELRCPGVLTSGATSAQNWITHFSACCALADYLKEHRTVHENNFHVQTVKSMVVHFWDCLGAHWTVHKNIAEPRKYSFDICKFSN